MQSELALRLTSFVGLFAMIGVAWLLSEARRKVDWRLVVWGIILQFVLPSLSCARFGKPFSQRQCDVRCPYGRHE